jgi:hypothetical protein
VRYRITKELPPWRWWHWRFALLPTWFGDGQRLWLEFYQCRMNGLHGERRTKDTLRTFWIHP